MAYGHAERTLAAIQLLEAETRELLSNQHQLDPEQGQWLRDAAERASRRLQSTEGRHLSKRPEAAGQDAFGMCESAVA